MSAAPAGTTVITAPRPDGTGPTVTLHCDPDTGVLAEPFAVTIEGGAANIAIRHANGAETSWTCISGAHITAAMLAGESIRTAADIHTLTVTAA